MTDIVDVERIGALNDILRRSLGGGTLVLTAGIVALSRERQQIILDAVAAFNRFDADNDPHGEHDFGALEAGGERVLFFKIDCFDRSGRFASRPAGPTPASPPTCSPSCSPGSTEVTGSDHRSAPLKRTARSARLVFTPPSRPRE